MKESIQLRSQALKKFSQKKVCMVCLKRGWPQTKCPLIVGSDAARPGREDEVSLGLNRPVPAITRF